MCLLDIGVVQLSPKYVGNFLFFLFLGGLVLIFFERVPGLRGKEDKDGELGICLRKVLIC